MQWSPMEAQWALRCEEGCDYEVCARCVTDLVAAIHEMLRDQVDHHGMPGAVESIVRRRLTRLLPLVAEGCE